MTERQKRLSIESLKNAFWQYLMEHAKRNENLDWEVYFTIKGRKKFFGKIEARRKGFKKFPDEFYKDKELILK